MHRNEAGISDLNSTVAVDHGMWTDEDIATEPDGTAEGVQHDACLQPRALADNDTSAPLAKSEAAIDAAPEQTWSSDLDARQAESEGAN